MSSKPTPTRTPARNNYAAPHTPIASVKRPRSSMDKSMMSPGGQKSSIPSTPLIPPPMENNDGNDGNKTPVVGRETLDRSQMSPMHPPRPLVIHEEGEEDPETGNRVTRQVDALFSPLLNFLTPEGEEGEHPTGTDNADKPAGSDNTAETTSHTTSQEASHDEAEEETLETKTHRKDHQQKQEEEEERVDDEEEQGEEEYDEEEEEGNVLVDEDSSQGSLEEDEFNPYVFIKSLPSYDLVAPLRPPISLPPKSKTAPPISLVLDLDETLVHCTVEPVDDADLVFPVVFHGMTYQVHVRLRPHLFDFLEKIHVEKQH